MKVEHISVKAAIPEFVKFTGHQGELDKSSIMSWANDAVERITTDEQLVHHIGVFNINNYIVELPSNLMYICQAAYKEDHTNKCVQKEQITQWIYKGLGTDCELEINIKCPKCHEESCSCGGNVIEVNADQLWRNSNPQHDIAYANHFIGYGGNTERGGGKLYQRSTIHPEFRLMKHTTSSFFNIPYHIDNCLNFSVDCEVEYSINPPTMNVNVKEGLVLLSYFGRPTDEEGYLMIPNNPTVMRAISYAMAERYLYIEYLKTKEQKDRIAWQMHIELTEKWTARARNLLQMPDQDEFSNFVRKFIHKVIPEYNYEENLYRGNSAKYAFKYPDQTENLKGFNRKR